MTHIWHQYKTLVIARSLFRLFEQEGISRPHGIQRDVGHIGYKQQLVGGW